MSKQPRIIVVGGRLPALEFARALARDSWVEPRIRPAPPFWSADYRNRRKVKC